MVEAVALGSEAIGFMCRSIAAWAEEVGKPKQHAESEDIQPIVDSIQVRHTYSQTDNAHQRMYVGDCWWPAYHRQHSGQALTLRQTVHTCEASVEI